MAKFNFPTMERKQDDNLRQLAKAFKERSNKPTKAVDKDVVNIKENVIRYAIVMDKALATETDKRYERKYLTMVTNKIRFMEEQASAKQIRKTIHKMGYWGVQRVAG